MATNRQIGAWIAWMIAIGAATGMVVGILQITPAVGAAAIGIVLGTAVARGALSTEWSPRRKNELFISKVSRSEQLEA